MFLPSHDFSTSFTSNASSANSLLGSSPPPWATPDGGRGAVLRTPSMNTVTFPCAVSVQIIW